jgi:hypothetical protein
MVEHTENRAAGPKADLENRKVVARFVAKYWYCLLRTP